MGKHPVLLLITFGSLAILPFALTDCYNRENPGVVASPLQSETGLHSMGPARVYLIFAKSSSDSINVPFYSLGVRVGESYVWE